MRVELDSQRSWLARSYLGDGDEAVTELSLRISGLPMGTQIKPIGSTLVVQGSDGATRAMRQAPPDLIDFESGIPSLRAMLTKLFILV